MFVQDTRHWFKYCCFLHFNFNLESWIVRWQPFRGLKSKVTLLPLPLPLPLQLPSSMFSEGDKSLLPEPESRFDYSCQTSCDHDRHPQTVLTRLCKESFWDYDCGIWVSSQSQFYLVWIAVQVGSRSRPLAKPIIHTFCTIDCFFFFLWSCGVGLLDWTWFVDCSWRLTRDSWLTYWLSLPFWPLTTHLTSPLTTLITHHSSLWWRIGQQLARIIAPSMCIAAWKTASLLHVCKNCRRSGMTLNLRWRLPLATWTNGSGVWIQVIRVRLHSCLLAVSSSLAEVRVISMIKEMVTVTV